MDRGFAGPYTIKQAKWGTLWEERGGGKEAVTQKCWHSQKHKALFSLQISGIMVPVDANLIAAKFDGT